MAAFLTSGSIDDLVQQMTTLDVIADRTDTVLTGYAEAQTAAQTAQQAADAAAAQAQQTLSDLQAQQAQLQEQEQQYKSRYATLTAAEQAAVDTALVGPSLAAPTATPPAPTAAAGVAVQTALAQVGDMYQTGGSGPDTFDCSGLTMYSYAAAGVTLPHSSRAQSQLGVPVSRADLQPGDLVFFYSPVSHVGIYIGNGMMVHASVTGRPVAVTGVDKPGYAGARRVTG
jgi:cell wall-associated NlpC family hydrolase